MRTAADSFGGGGALEAFGIGREIVVKKSSSGKRVPGLLVPGRPVAFTTVKLLREFVQIEIGIEFCISESQGNFH
jgi:hypothetical protein